MAPKGISNRTLLAKQKGIRMGQTIMVAYRDDGKTDKKIYEGILSDRRIGGTDRESYLELKRCLLLGANSEIIAMEGNKRFVDAFIDDMDVTDPRNEAEISLFLNAAPPASGAASPDMGGMGGMMGMPGMGCMGMGMPGMGAMPMMGMNPMMMGMNPMMMGMNPMMMGMNPMMGMGGMGMNPMMAMMASSMMGNQGDGGGGACGSSFGPSGDGSSGNGADVGSNGNGASATGGFGGVGGGERAAAASLPPLVEEPAMSPQELAAAVEAVEDGARIEVTYTHPQLGKTTYRGILREKFIGASHVQSYMFVDGCQRIGRRGHLREVEPRKRLMLAFVDGVRELPADDGAELPAGPEAPGDGVPATAKRRSRSRSRDRGSG